VASSRCRLENLINLFISGKQPPLTGNAKFHFHADVPRKHKSFLGEMTANGEFGVGGGKFNDKDTEQGLTRLSESTKPGKVEKAEKEDNPEMLLSELKGKVSAARGVSHLSHVEFSIPGAHAWVDGTFGLLNHQTDMHGTLITEGDVSATETGVRSLLLKALTPFLKHKNNAKMVPFKIAGPYGNVSISLDMNATQEKNWQKEKSGTKK
jgi:hypothetical protein